VRFVLTETRIFGLHIYLLGSANYHQRKYIVIVVYLRKYVYCLFCVVNYFGSLF